MTEHEGQIEGQAPAEPTRDELEDAIVAVGDFRGEVALGFVVVVAVHEDAGDHVRTRVRVPYGSDAWRRVSFETREVYVCWYAWPHEVFRHYEHQELAAGAAARWISDAPVVGLDDGQEGGS